MPPPALTPLLPPPPRLITDAKRDSWVMLHVGAMRTGKTTGTRQMMTDMWEPPQRKPSLVFDSNNQKDYDDLIPISVDDLPRWAETWPRYARPWFVCRDVDDLDWFFTYLHQYVRNTFVVFEDATGYLNSKLTKTQLRPILNSRNACNDIMLNQHSLADVQPDLYRAAWWLWLRHTADGEIPAKARMPHLIGRALEEINAENQRLYPTGHNKLASRLIEFGTGLIY